MPVSPKFNFKQLDDLSTDFSKSVKSLPIVVQSVMRQHIRPLVAQLRRQFPKATGAMRNTFGYSLKTKRGKVTAMVGLFMRRRASVSAIVSGNVLQHPGAVARKGKFLWIPLPGNRNADGSPMNSPRQLLDAGGFVRRSKAGNIIAFKRTGQGEIMPMFILRLQMQFKQPPVPYETRTEQQVPEIIEDIPEMMAQLIEARKLAGVV